jgi:hypothetical protein
MHPEPQLACAHRLFDGAEPASQAPAMSGILAGEYDNSADTVGLGAKYRF